MWPGLPSTSSRNVVEDTGRVFKAIALNGLQAASWHHTANPSKDGITSSICMVRSTTGEIVVYRMDSGHRCLCHLMENLNTIVTGNHLKSDNTESIDYNPH